MTQRTFAFVSLGCPKNLVDSERMLGKLAQDGYALTPDADGADVVVVNTCGFIEPARQESLGRHPRDARPEGAGQGRRRRRRRLPGRAQEGRRCSQEVPDVDQIVGVFGREEIAQVVDRAAAAQPRTNSASLFRPAPVRALEDTARLRITPRHYAYLKISEGCDRLCTFCAIPGMRGKHVTKPIEEVRPRGPRAGRRRRPRADPRRPGHDLLRPGPLRPGAPRRAAARARPGRRHRVDPRPLRLPDHFTDELIETLAGAKKIIPYLDMPLQHINDRVLQADAAARAAAAETEELLGRLRAAIPGLALRTTFIVGFPGETDAEFEELCEFVAGDALRARRRLPVLARAGHAGDAARRPSARRGQARAPRPAHGGAAGRSPSPGAQAQVGKELEVIVDGPDPEVPNHVPGPRPRRRPGHRLPGPRQGQEPAAGRPRARQDDRRRRLRSGRPGGRRGALSEHDG